MTIYVPGKLTFRKDYIGTDDPDAAAYIAAVEAADGEALETDVQVAIHSFVKGCKNDGIWDAIKACCILAGARTLAGALVPLVGAAPTNVNFVAGDYDRETGLVGDGSTKYLDSNRDNNADPQNNQHVSVYATFVGINAAISMLTSATANGSTHVGRGGVRSQCSQAYEVIMQNGLNAVSRSQSASYVHRVANASATISQASQTPSSDRIVVFHNPSLLSSTHRLAFYSIGEALDLALLDARVTALVNAIGAAIP